jgi:hypothetical protein
LVLSHLLLLEWISHRVIHLLVIALHELLVAACRVLMLIVSSPAEAATVVKAASTSLIVVTATHVPFRSLTLRIGILTMVIRWLSIRDAVGVLEVVVSGKRAKVLDIEFFFQFNLMPVLDVLQDKLGSLEDLVANLASLAHDILDYDFFNLILAVLVFNFVELVIILGVV